MRAEPNPFQQMWVQIQTRNQANLSPVLSSLGSRAERFWTNREHSRLCTSPFPCFSSIDRESGLTFSIIRICNYSIHQKGAEWLPQDFEQPIRRYPHTTQLWQSMLYVKWNRRSRNKQHSNSRHCSHEIMTPIDPKHNMSKTLHR